MGFLDVLENRMGDIFERGNGMCPLPMKRLGKQIIRQMKSSSAKVDGRDFAPSLYTVLVSPQDDAMIAPVYPDVTRELMAFIESQTRESGKVLMAPPLVRFIASANEKPGAPRVVAEVVTPDILRDLRAEEAEYAKACSRGAGWATPRQPQPMGLQQAPAPTFQPMAAPQPALNDPAPAPAYQPAPAPQAIFEQGAQGGFDSAPAPVFEPAPLMQPASTGPACELIDQATGKVWHVSAARTVIGRVGAGADLLLEDTNVSRNHAALTSDASGWSIEDLGSTNGTMVNGAKVSSAHLSTGDVICLGLVTLKFREC